MSDLISREGVLNILQYFNSTQWLRLIKILPSAEAGLIAKIQNGIKATDADDAYSCGMRNGMRWCMSLIDDKEPLYETCPSAQPEQKHGQWLTKEYMHGDHDVGIDDMWVDRLAEQSDYYAYCSICNKDAEYNAEGSLILSDYCPNCGARMGGDA